MSLPRHLDALLRLEPVGGRSIEDGSVSRSEIETIGTGLDDHTARAADLVTESRPQDADQLLTRWESLYKLRSGGRDAAERRARLLAKVALIPDMTPETIRGIVEAWTGRDVRVVEPFAWRCDGSTLCDSDDLLDGANCFILEFAWADAQASSLNTTTLLALVADCKPAHTSASVRFVGLHCNSTYSRLNRDLLE